MRAAVVLTTFSLAAWGAVLLAVAAAHAGSLALSRRLRGHWRALWPVRSDVAEAAGSLAYNLGLSSRRPRLSAHSYVEKAEYWAVVWGTVVMALTGLMLWFNDLAHLYEAILATLSIVVWHFYWVIFDPEVYPLETAFLTGISVKRREEEPDQSPAAEEAQFEEN